MNRRTIVVAVVAIAALTLVAVPANAAPTPRPMGTLNCFTTGAASLKPHGLPPVAPATSDTTLKGAGDLVSCDASGVTGGDKTINAGTITLNGKIPRGATCSSVFSDATRINHRSLTIRLKNSSVDSHGHTQLSTVATLHPDAVLIVANGNGFGVTGTVPQSNKGNAPFGGEALAAQLNFDNFSDALDCSNGTGSSLTSIQWSTAGGSTFSIQPPASGILVCGSTGSAELSSHGIPAGVTTGSRSFNASGTLDSGDSNVTGGNAVINAGTIDFAGRFPSGISCATLFSTPMEFTSSSSNRFDIRLQHVDLNGFGFSVTTEVARVRARIAESSNSDTSFVLLGEAIPGVGAFHGEGMAFLLDVDNLTEVSDCAAGTAPLTKLDWTSTDGGGLLIVPPF